jgi:hypothetical protein
MRELLYRQVQHILASTFASRCVVWDLRKNDPIIKVSDSTSRMRCKVGLQLFPISMSVFLYKMYCVFLDKMYCSCQVLYDDVFG